MRVAKARRPVPSARTRPSAAFSGAMAHRASPPGKSVDFGGMGLATGGGATLGLAAQAASARTWMKAPLVFIREDFNTNGAPSTSAIREARRPILRHRRGRLARVARLQELQDIRDR